MPKRQYPTEPVKSEENKPAWYYVGKNKMFWCHVPGCMHVCSYYGSRDHGKSAKCNTCLNKVGKAPVKYDKYK